MKRISLILIQILLIGFSAFSQFVSTNVSRIQTDFAANWTDGSFPRLFGNLTDIQNIKNLYQSNDVLVKKTVDKIISEANSALTKTIPTWGLDAANLRVSSVHTISKEFIPQLSIAYLITGDQKYAQRAWQVAKVLMTYQDWGVSTTSPFKDRHFLDTGIGAYNAAMLYDALYSWTNQAQKDSLYQMARKYVFVPAQAQYNGTASRTWAWMYANNNWNGICNGGVAAAAFTMFEHDKDFLSDVASKAINCLPNYINAFEPDGQSEEGLMYWSYGLMYTVTTFDIMKRVLGSTYGYAETNGLKKTGYFPVYTSGPVATLNVGDDGVRNNRSNSLMWFSKHLNDSNLAKLTYDLFLENGQTMSWFDLFHYLPDLVNKGKELNIGQDNYIRGIDLYSFVERWKDRNALYLAVHAGDNRANHGHLDAGSFYIQGLGEYWAFGNLGSDSYTNAGYFDFGAGNNDCLPSYSGTNYTPTSSQSWHFYRKRAEGKNTVVYNPDFRADQNPVQEAVYKGFINSSENVGCGTINMNMIYSRDVNTHTRGFKLDRARRVITIQDKISAKENKNIWWSMHTKATVSLSADKRTATLTQNGKSMVFVLRSPSNAEFQVLNATYLEGRNFPLTTNSANSGFRKLAVNLRNTKDVVVRIEAYPAIDGEKEELIDDYEGFHYNYQSVGFVRIESNIQNPTPNDVNASALVMKVTKLSGAADQSGIKLMNKNVAVGFAKGQYRFLKMKLLKSSSGPVSLKLENSSDNTFAEYNPTTSTFTTGAWVEYNFDLMTDKNGISQEGKSFNSVIIFPENSATANLVTYIDDLRFSNVIDNNPVNVAFAQRKVENVTVVNRAATNLSLQWKTVEGATQYNVYKNKTLYRTLTDTVCTITELVAGDVYKFSVTAQNSFLQPSLSSDEIMINTRFKSLENEYVDNFENVYVPWTGFAGAVVYPDQSNPASSVVNSSAKTLKLTRMAYASRDVALMLSGHDAFDLTQLPSYLHVKMYRGLVSGGVSVELSNQNNGAVLKRLKPLNTADTLHTSKWVDFVFDLNGNEEVKTYNVLKIFPDHTASYSSTKNYFIDDVLFSNAGNPFTSVKNTVSDSDLFVLTRQGNHYLLLNNSGANIRVRLSDLSGRNLWSDDTDAASLTIPSLMFKGVYLLNIASNGQVYSRKIVL